MANEYNELEQLVNDVTNIDTARMTLRWALERLNSIEKEKADLKKNLTITEDTKKGLELKVQSLEDTFKSRGKSLDEKEGFYNKLEATMSLLGDGKLDIQQLLKKEAKLDHLRLELENEYQDKFEELDKNQSSVIERWNARLLDVEGQYAKRLSEAQVRYDSLRAGLETDYQDRLGALNKSFRNKETELTERIKALETSVKAGGDTLEGRRKELEAEFMTRKNEIEVNYHKLKNTLETGFQERVHSAEDDHCAQVKSLERTWNAERERLMAEQHARDEQFEISQLEMAKLEAQLSGQQEQHHAELLDIITKKEEAFRAKVVSLEKEKTAYEAAVKNLMVQLENKENEWIADKEQLRAEFLRRSAEMEASVRERGAALEKECGIRKDELKNEAAARVEAARRDMEAEKVRLADINRAKESELTEARASISKLEQDLSASGDEHHNELMERIRSNEEAFRVKLAEFEAEKEEYKIVIARLVDEAGAKDGLFIEEKKRLQEEFNQKYSSLEAGLSAGDTKTKAAYESRISALLSSFEEKEKAWVLEREKLGNELTAISENAQALAAERVEKIKAAYEARKAELEKQLEEKIAVRAAALEFEKERVNSELAAVRTELEKAAGRAKELENELSGDRATHHAALMEKLAEKEAALKTQAAYFDKELALKDEQATKYARELAAKENRWAEEKETRYADFASRSQLIETELADRERALESRYRLKAGEADKNASDIRAMLQADFDRKLAVEKEALENVKAALAEADKMREEELAKARSLAEERVQKMKADYDDRKAEVEKQCGEKLSAASTALEFERSTWRTQNERLESLLAATVEDFKHVQNETKELSDALSLKEDEISRLKGEMAGQVRQSAEALRHAESDGVARKSAEIEAAFKERQAHLESEMAALRDALEKEYRNRQEELSKDLDSRTLPLRLENESLKNTVQKLREEVSGAAEKAEAYVNEKIESAAAKATQLLQEKLHFMESELNRVEQHTKDERRIMEETFNKERERLVEDLDRKNKYIEVVDFKLQEMESDLMKNRQNSATNMLDQDEIFKTLVRDFELRQEKLEADGARAIEERKARLEGETVALRAALEKEYWKRQEELSGDLEAKTLPLKLENEGLKKMVEKMREEVAGAAAKAEAYVKEKVESASAKATQLLQEKLNFMESELNRMEQHAKDERRIVEETSNKERERLTEELGRKNNYIEVVDHKLQEMENELMKTRQNSVVSFLGQIADQDDKFKAVAEQYEVRQDKVEIEAAGRVEEIRASAEVRLKNMEEMLKAKEKLLLEGGEFWRQKEAELDGQNSELNMKMHQFNEELFAQKQELSGKEKQLNEYRLSLEKDNAARMNDLEKLKIELARAIMDYKNRK